MEITLRLQIRNVLENAGDVYVALYNSEASFKKGQPHLGFILKSTDTTLYHSVRVQEGEYVLSLFQDTNRNGRLDMNLLGIPKEPIGLSNYTGKGIPGGFDKQKVKIIEANQEIIVTMIRLL